MFRRKYFNFLLRIVRVLMQPGKIQEIISSAVRDAETRVPCCQDYHGSCLSTNVIFAYAAILNKTVSNTLSFFSCSFLFSTFLRLLFHIGAAYAHIR